MQHICALDLIIADRFNKRQIRRNTVICIHRVTIPLHCSINHRLVLPHSCIIKLLELHEVWRLQMISQLFSIRHVVALKVHYQTSSKLSAARFRTQYTKSHVCLQKFQIIIESIVGIADKSHFTSVTCMFLYEFHMDYIM